MLTNTEYADNSRNREELTRLAPAVAIIVMTVASWVGVFTVFVRAAEKGPSVPVTTVESVYDSAAWR